MSIGLRFLRANRLALGQGTLFSLKCIVFLSYSDTSIGIANALNIDVNRITHPQKYKTKGNMPNTLKYKTHNTYVIFITQISRRLKITLAFVLSKR